MVQNGCLLFGISIGLTCFCPSDFFCVNALGGKRAFSFVEFCLPVTTAFKIQNYAVNYEVINGIFNSPCIYNFVATPSH